MFVLFGVCMHVHTFIVVERIISIYCKTPTATHRRPLRLQSGIGGRVRGKEHLPNSPSNFFGHWGHRTNKGTENLSNLASSPSNSAEIEPSGPKTEPKLGPGRSADRGKRLPSDSNTEGWDLIEIGIRNSRDVSSEPLILRSY